MPAILNSAAKISILCFLLLIIFYAIMLWKKYSLTGRPLLLQPAVFLGLLTIGSYVLTSLIGIQFIVLAIELSSAIIIGFINPVFLASLFVVSLLIKPWEIIAANSEIAILPRSLAILCICSCILYFLRIRRFKFKISDSFLLFLAFFGWTLFSSAISSNSQESVSQFMALCIPLIMVFIILNFVIEDKYDWQILTGSMIIGVLGVVLIALNRTIWDWNFSVSELPRLDGEGHWSNANDIASLIVLVLPFIFYSMLLRNKSLLKFIAGLTSVIICFLAIWFSQSRATIFALVCSCFALVSINRKINSQTILTIIFCFLIASFFLGSIARDQSDLEGSSSMRLEYMYSGFRMLIANPLTGVGFENYDNFFELYTTKFDEFGRRTAHSSWILAMAETGIIGMLLFCSFCLKIFLSAYKLRRKIPELYLACVGYGICMSFLSHTFQLPFYILAALIINAERIYAQDYNYEDSSE